MKTIRWGQVTRSGLCDRLEDLLLMTAYARLKNAKLLVEWPEFEAKDIDVAHRSQDIRLENILKFMSFPDEIFWNSKIEADEHFGPYLGGAISPEKFHAEHLKDICSPEHFQVIVNDVAREFGFNPFITDFVQTLPSEFITFHIRRGDKVRLAKEHDGTFILKGELSQLDRFTYRAINFFANQKYKTCFICGDEDQALSHFIRYAKICGMEVIELPAMPKWESTFYDLAVMTMSDMNICSQRYSSFSHFPSVIGRGTFATVYDLQKQGVI